ncbi:hypothetical protein [Ornithinicoccus hortensis]|uniref:Secreted protein n=1 Tax=Ornithinicoccus hortensis TaxID=82346 RepID=A0A542YRA5_9MICO|nr:hypothetical protein [Ornithinicoccus hortensis]TQL50643.1 hypothetical protein FB467_1756 [Ornithinicoccus hortensis]
MKLLKHALATTAAVVIGGTMFAGVPANAAGSNCDGTQVKTCMNVRISGGKATPAARITDMPDGVDFQVKTTHVVLQRQSSNGTWTNATAVVKDFDGWHDREDLALGKAVPCKPGHPVKVRAKARFDWKRIGSDHEWAYSKPVNLICAN